jgi:hypothetical protein
LLLIASYKIQLMMKMDKSNTIKASKKKEEEEERKERTI